MERYVHSTKYFYGHEISEYGLENGYIDYRTLARAVGDMVLNNDIIKNTLNIGYWEEYNGSEYDPETDTYEDIYQYYIISDHGAGILAAHTEEIVFYNEALDMYVWGITHWGTAWGHVLTDIKVKVEE